MLLLMEMLELWLELFVFMLLVLLLAAACESPDNPHPRLAVTGSADGDKVDVGERFECAILVLLELPVSGAPAFALLTELL
jgi:hypothetical protein